MLSKFYFIKMCTLQLWCFLLLFCVFFFLCLLLLFFIVFSFFCLFNLNVSFVNSVCSFQSSKLKQMHLRIPLFIHIIRPWMNKIAGRRLQMKYDSSIHEYIGRMISSMDEKLHFHPRCHPIFAFIHGWINLSKAETISVFKWKKWMNFLVMDEYHGWILLKRVYSDN